MFAWGDRSCTLTQTAYTDALAERYRLTSAKNVYTPMSPSFYGDARANEHDPSINNTDYRHIIGSLLYISTRSRPDIATAVGILAQHVVNPTMFLLKAARRVIVYLYHTRCYGLTFKETDRPSGLECWPGSDYAGDHQDRKSRSGFVGMLSGAAVVWHSRKQTCTALSTAEAEYIALSDSCREIVVLRSFLKNISRLENTATPIGVDNVTAEQWAKGTATMRRAKHVEVRYFYAADCVNKKIVTVYHVSSKDNRSDGFTKPLDRVAFENFRMSIGVMTP